MDLSDKDIEQIESYLFGELTDEERTTVEQRMKTDPEFADQVNFMRDIINVSKQKGRQHLRENLKKAEQKEAAKIEAEIDKEGESTTKQKKTNIRHNWFYWVTAVAAAAIAGYFFGIIIPSGDGKKIYHEHFEPYPNKVIPSTRGREVPENFAHFSQEKYNFVVRAMKHYQRGNYEEAAKLFEQHVERKRENAALILYKGISQLKSGKEEQAEMNFSYLLNLKNAEFQQEAQWYKALTYLKTNDTEDAWEILRKISETPGHPYKNKAKKVIGEIRGQ
jgi:tetratricopeptide (TPR) repeat protein